jgi:hypothetical protein
MGGLGNSSSTQTQTQQSQTQPWFASIPTMGGILQGLNGYLQNGGWQATGGQLNALSGIENNSTAIANAFSPQVNGVVSSLLAGGGALNQAGNIQNAYDQFNARMSPAANATNFDPMSDPNFANMINTQKDDISNATRGQFAAAGRDLSGYDAQTTARGIMQGISPTLASQYNANRTNQQGAAKDIYNAGIGNAGILSGLQQQYLANQQAGVGGVSDANNIANIGNNAILQAEAQRLGIPLQNLGLIANIGVPIAGLGKTGFSTGQTQTQNNPSILSDISGGMGIFGGLFPSFAKGGLPGFISDRRAKEDISQVGALFDGTPVYRFRYKGHPAFQIGLMAQDVEEYAPEAVGRIGEYKAVDYKLATDRAVR